MRRDHSKKNLQNVSFSDKELSFANFAGSDLRGASFSGANLTGADFTNVKTGITPLNTIWLFIAALIISAYSGYTAMQAGQLIQSMIFSTEGNMRVSGVVCAIVMVLFILFSIWRGVGHAVKHMVIPCTAVALVVAAMNIVTGTGTGIGVFYLILCCMLIVIMFITGTVARAVAGTLSNVLFLVVILVGVLFSRSAGGYLAVFIMSVGCALVSKRALSGAKGFELLRKIIAYIASRFGTSFRNTRLMHANFSESELCNADFSNADISFINWENSKKTNCIICPEVEQALRKASPAVQKSSEELAVENMMLTYEQTLMTWIRTTTLMILFGFAIDVFFYTMGDKKDMHSGILYPGVAGTIIIAAGCLGLLLAYIQYHTAARKLQEDSNTETRRPFASMLALLMLILGFFLLIDALVMTT